VVISLPPPPLPFSAVERVPYADNGNGTGGGRFDNPRYDPNEGSGPKSPHAAASLGIYRAALLVGTVWILVLFATLTIVLEFTRAHSKHWSPISFPQLLYVDTAILLLSSVTIEFSRLSWRGEVSRRCARLLVATLLFGLAFVGGQIAVWQQLHSRGLHLASGGASFFFYLMTATHALTVLGGIIALLPVMLVVSRLRRGSRRQAPIGIVAQYWHFVCGLWLCVLALLFVTVQR
jgi:cytochrome c oxidase subunit III